MILAVSSSARASSRGTSSPREAQRLCEIVSAVGGGGRWSAVSNCGALEALLCAVSPSAFFGKPQVEGPGPRRDGDGGGLDFEGHFRLLMGSTLVFQDWTRFLTCEDGVSQDVSFHVTARVAQVSGSRRLIERLSSDLSLIHI